MKPTIKEIAEGAPFDTTTTIRSLCQYLVDARPFATHESLADISAPELGEPSGPLPPRLVELLAANGYFTAEQLRHTDDADLLAIEGIATKTLKLIRTNLKA